MKTILVTGGAGFIGSHFVRSLVVEKKYFVVNIDLLTYAGNLKNLKEIYSYENYKFIQGDIRDRELIEQLFYSFNFDYVVNFAAESHVDRSIISANDFISTNILGAQTLMDVALSYWTREKSTSDLINKKFIQISTDEVYGSILNGDFDEESPISPNSPYSASKASADLIARAYFKTYNFPVIVTRCTNNYGINQYPEKLIPYFISLIQKDSPIPLYGDGNQIRDWIHVYDHCEAIKGVLESGRIGEIYNIGANNELRNIEIAKLLLKLMNKSERLIKYVLDRPGHDFRYAINSNKIRDEIGWQPKIDFQFGLDELIKLSLSSSEEQF